ncbi:unnamed protein product [Rotaria sp. Silwood2]|nr:unnamed protein product [Rotaria sp. Silwood2]CAF2831724.1 unnamed protein product [Rotaria sp. Silwood2]CAF3028777.1 unnamed protein product [Rotaria sp. Silwood2]CAF3192038.1 unnamed protein product [Rotaria sp. Silwood2]CAF4075487.1 unnamed protein product [Rotaria sp. Silwood2]
MPIKDKNGNLLLNLPGRLEPWHDYFDELLNVPSPIDQKPIDEIQIVTISKEEEEEEERQGAGQPMEEVRSTLAQMKSWKVPRNDEMTADLL